MGKSINMLLFLGVDMSQTGIESMFQKGHHSTYEASTCRWQQTNSNIIHLSLILYEARTVLLSRLRFGTCNSGRLNADYQCN